MSSERRQCMLYVVFSVMIAFQFKNVESFSKGALFRSTNSLVVGRVSDLVLAAAPSAATSTGSFIDTELRGAAMRLHTRQQAPKEGKAKAPAPPKENYVTTHADYLQFLVDNQHVFQTLEDLVNEKPELAVFVNTGLERSAPLEKDICFMVEEYGLPRPAVGKAGTEYAKVLRSIESIPELVCHFYNIYFAHTAGGIMIGKKMSALLLDKKTLEFYKVCRE